MVDSNLEIQNKAGKSSSTIFEKCFWLLIYFLSPLIPIYAIYSSNSLKFKGTLNFASMVAGSVGFVWLGYEFILSARPKFIERCFGLDKFYVFHGFMAVVSIILVFIHRTILEDRFGHTTLTFFGNVAFFAFIGIIVLGILFIASTFLLKIKLILDIKKFFLKYSIFTYNNQVLIHNLSIAAYIVMFIHVLLTRAVRENPGVMTVFIIYFVLGIAFYIYHTFIIKLILAKNRYVVKDVIKESDNMWTLNLTPKNGKMLAFKSGQFAYIKIFGENVKAEPHSFSISSSALNKEYISFSIKELGDFTAQIKNVKPGDLVRVDAPFGKFSYLEHPEETATIFLSGGIGITPSLSMLRYMRDGDKDRNAILLWGVGNAKELICSEEFVEMQKEMKNFHFVPIMFRDETWKGEKGIVDRDKIERYSKAANVDIKTAGFYICGPARMTDSVLSTLKAMGIDRKFIHFEKFSM